MRFDVCAHTYDEYAGPQQFFAELVAQFILAGGSGISSARSESVLELGAGTGALTRHLVKATNANWAGSKSLIFASDASTTMVERGRLAVPQAQWSVLDAFNAPLPPATLQVSSGLLHWAADPVSTLVRWKTHLAPDGRMVHAIPCDPCLAEWRALVPESPVPWRSETEWLNIFQRAGLKVTRSQSWQHIAACSSALEMVRGFHRTGVTGRAHIGPTRLRQALRAYDAKHQASDGVQATWVWLAIEATPTK